MSQNLILCSFMLYSTVLFMMTKRLRTKNNYPQHLSKVEIRISQIFHGTRIRSDNQIVGCIYRVCDGHILVASSGDAKEKRLKLIVK